jgi:hypothetical protein
MNVKQAVSSVIVSRVWTVTSTVSEALEDDQGNITSAEGVNECEESL